MKKISGFILIALLLSLPAASFANESVGDIKAAEQGWVLREDAKNDAAAGDKIFVADVLGTGKGGKIEVVFDDGTELALGPDSEASVNDFVMSDTKNNFNAKIAKGAARVVTGSLVKRNPNGFRITTPRSTVGIRGTELIFGIDARGNEVVSVTDIGDNSHVTIIDKTGKRHKIDMTGYTYFSHVGQESYVVKNNDRIQELLDMIMTLPGQSGELVDLLIDEIGRQIEETPPPGTSPATGDLPIGVEDTAFEQIEKERNRNDKPDGQGSTNPRPRPGACD